MRSAYLVGACIIVADDASWFLPEHLLWYVPVSLKNYLDPMRKAMLSDALTWMGLLIAGFATSALAPRAKIRLALALAPTAAAIFGFGHFGVSLVRSAVDFPGPQGALLVAFVALVAGVVCCGVGGAAGWLVTRRHHA
jgi:hypothetical protein